MDVVTIKSIEGVLGVVESDTLQVVLGPGKVEKIGAEFAELTGIPLGTAEEPTAEELAKENKAERKAMQNHPVQRFLRRIANIFVPLLPGIIAAGLINGICNVINVSSKGALSGIWWYECIRSIGWALFAYLPIFVGMNAAKEFKGSPILGALAGAMCIANAGMPLLTKFNKTEVLLPFTGKVYNPAAGGLLAALIAGIFFAWLEKQIRKIMPDILQTFFAPLFTVIIGALVTLLVLQPIGAGLTTGIFGGLDFIYTKLGAIGGYILTACLGSGFGGILASLFHLGTVSQGVSGLFGLLIVVPGTQIYYILAMVAAYIGGFVLTYFFGVDENRINEVYGTK